MNKQDLRKIIQEKITNFKLGVNEIMIPTNNNKIIQYSNTNYIIVAKDDITHDSLVLFTELHKENNYYIYSYYFVVFDKNNKPKSQRLYTRNEASKYLPKEIKSNMIPKILDMTRMLINRIKPDIIQRETAEKLTEKSMKRYDIISQLLQDELGYELVTHNIDSKNGHRWTFVKDNLNIDLDENTILDHYNKRPSFYDTVLVRAHEKFLKELEKNPIKL
jgi:hypothetical protein